MDGPPLHPAVGKSPAVPTSQENVLATSLTAVGGSTSRHHFATIDALRGFAALSVVLFHLGGAGLPKLSSPPTTSLTSWGWTGVEVFFVISGFVIPFVMLKADYRVQDAGNFLARRFIRIWPPSALLIALTVAQFAVVDRMQGGVSADWASPSATRVLANLFYVVPFTGHGWLNGVLWTLAVEFQYYLFLALVFPLLARSRAALIGMGIVSLFSAQLPGAETVLFLKFAVYFAMGGLVLLYREQRLGRTGFLALLGVMAVAATTQLGQLPTGFAVIATLTIAFVPIRNRLFLFLGTISYSLYLVHMLVASTVEFVLVRMFDPTSPPARLATQLVCVLIAIGGGWVFYQLVERHFVTLSQRLARINSRPTQAPMKEIADEGL